MKPNPILKFTLQPELALDQAKFSAFLQGKVGHTHFRLLKRSIDARKKKVRVHVQVEVGKTLQNTALWKPNFPNPGTKTCLIVGSGPAGLFAAIRCLEKGIRPVIVERGKDVRTRRRDLANLNKNSIVDPDSNYCFGEGGAGTYSDGKLYTRSTKRGDVNKILEILYYHGAREEILYDSHPHIGTNKLPDVVTSIRKMILENNGEIHFGTRIADIKTKGNKVISMSTSEGDELKSDYFILATGHSARDIFELLDARKIQILAKPFALGVRVEHPQSIIDRVQYHLREDRPHYLPAASYALTHQTRNNKAVFSFCMCPGGFIVPSATSPGEIVVNGMSPSKRDSFYANSGIVVSVNDDDFKEYERFGNLAGMYYQADIERKAFELTDHSQVAPAQKLVDFVGQKVSNQLNDTSYIPGIKSVNFDELLPSNIIKALRESFVSFGKKMKGYYSNEGQMIGIESRTSSPIRIPRDKELLSHPQFENFYPCGEGAGYAGGIVSAAIDGMACAEVLK